MIGKCLYTAVKLVFCPGAVVESIANSALRYARAVVAGEVHRRARGQIYRAPPAKTDSLVSSNPSPRAPSSGLLLLKVVEKLESRWPCYIGYILNINICTSYEIHVDNTRVETFKAGSTGLDTLKASVMVNGIYIWAAVSLRYCLMVAKLILHCHCFVWFLNNNWYNTFVYRFCDFSVFKGISVFHIWNFLSGSLLHPGSLTLETCYRL